MEMTCKQRETIATGYWGTGMAFYSVGAIPQALYWWGKADGLMVGC
jgi:hypothetical protein